MSPLATPEAHWFVLLRAARVLHAEGDCLAALAGLAAHSIARGDTQEGADILAWVQRQPFLPPTVQADAKALWDELATWICPRVLLDAADFAQYATLDDLCEYVTLPT